MDEQEVEVTVTFQNGHKAIRKAKYRERQNAAPDPRGYAYGKQYMECEVFWTEDWRHGNS